MRRLSFGLIAAVMFPVTVLSGAMLSGATLAADPIKIGLVNETTGPNAEAGSYTVNGTKLAVEEINAKGGIMGRQIELRIEDNQSTNPGTVLAYSKLTGEGDITAIVGPIRSTQIQAASPTIQKGGIPALVGGTDPSLTKVNNPWIFRVRPNDSYSSRVIADFGINSLKLKKVGDRALHGCLRLRRHEGADGALCSPPASLQCSPRATPTTRRITRRSCSRSRSPVPTSWRPI